MFSDTKSSSDALQILDEYSIPMTIQPCMVSRSPSMRSASPEGSYTSIGLSPRRFLQPKRPREAFNTFCDVCLHLLQSLSMHFSTLTLLVAIFIDVFLTVLYSFESVIFSLAINLFRFVLELIQIVGFKKRFRRTFLKLKTMIVRFFHCQLKKHSVENNVSPSSLCPSRCINVLRTSIDEDKWFRKPSESEVYVLPFITIWQKVVFFLE